MGPENRLVRIVGPGIGGGHPTLRDALFVYAQDRFPDIRVESHDLLTQGHFLTKAALRLVETIYTQGAQGLFRQELYERLRRATARENPGPLSKLITSEIDPFLNNDGVVVVTHNLVLGGRRTRERGEGEGHLYLAQIDIRVPGNAVSGADLIMVPVEESVGYLVDQGVAPEQIREIGFMVHPILIKTLDQTDSGVRKEKLTTGPLHLGLFLSGASPAVHREAILACLQSCRPYFRSAGWRATVVPMFDRGFAKEAEQFARRELGLRTGFDDDTASDELWQVRIVRPRGSKTDIIRRSHQIAGGVEIIFSGLCNERHPWPINLATLSRGNQIGAAARSNLDWAVNRGVVVVVHQPERFGDQLAALIQNGSSGLYDQYLRRQDLPVQGTARVWEVILDASR